MCRDADCPIDLAAAKHFDDGPLADQTGRGHGLGGYDVGLERSERIKVHRRVLHPKGVLEPAQLWDPLHQRELTPLEPCRNLSSRLLALHSAPSRLPAPATDASANPTVRTLGTLGRSQVVKLHAWTSSTDTRWGTRASIPRISGRSGSRFSCPMPRRPKARNVPRCFGLVPMAERSWTTRSRVPCPESGLAVFSSATGFPAPAFSAGAGFAAPAFLTAFFAAAGFSATAFFSTTPQPPSE